MKKHSGFALVLALASIGLGACGPVDDKADGGDVGTDDSGSDTPSDTPVDSGDTGDAATDTPTPTLGGADYSSPPDAVTIRFVVATPQLKTAEQFDVCYYQDSMGTGIYKGPVAAALGGGLTAPEITNFFRLTDVKEGEPVKVRLVKAGTTTAPCDKTNRFKTSDGFDVSIKDDTTNKPTKGYNTMVIYGAMATGTDSLDALLVNDPGLGAEPKAPVPTLQFFQGLKGATLGVTLTDAAGTAYTLSGATSLAYAFYGLIKFGTAYDKPVAITGINFDLGGTKFSVKASDYSVNNGYFWMIAYGTATAGLAYACTGPAKEASAGDLFMKECNLFSP